MTLSDELRKTARRTYGVDASERLLVVADRIDNLEADNAASALLIADQAYRIGQLEAELARFNPTVDVELWGSDWFRYTRGEISVWLREDGAA